MHRIKKRIKKTNIAIIYHQVPLTNKTGTEKSHHIVDHDTNNSVRLVQRVLKSYGFVVQLIKLTGDDLTPLKRINADYIFNLTDSREMEVKISSVLERVSIPYSGSALSAIQNSNNKIRTKKLLQKLGIPTPPFLAIMPHTKIVKSLLPSKYPFIIKPAYEHCSIGITSKSVALNFKQLKNRIKYLRGEVKQTLLCESFIKGKEIQILVLERDNMTMALPPVEMKFRGKSKSKWNIYGFTEKWDKRSTLFKNVYFDSPAKGLNPSILRAMQRDAIRAFYAMDFKDYGRFDVRYNTKTKKWYFLEGNANPGLSVNPDDALMASLMSVNLTFDDLILGIISNKITLHIRKKWRHV